MKILVACVAATAFLMTMACSSVSDNNTNTAVKVSANANSNLQSNSNGGQTADTFPSGPAVGSNQSVNGDANVAPGVTGRTIQKQGITSTSVEQARAAASKGAQPAPDNSTFFTFLVDKSYEVRTFKSDTQLLRVERVTSTGGESIAKIYFRDGKVVELEGGRFPQLASMPADFIVEAAGITRVYPPSKQTRSGVKVKNKEQ